jgi:hypothetical protein
MPTVFDSRSDIIRAFDHVFPPTKPLLARLTDEGDEGYALTAFGSRSAAPD